MSSVSYHPLSLTVPSSSSLTVPKGSESADEKSMAVTEEGETYSEWLELRLGLLTTNPGQERLPVLLGEG